MPKPSPDIANRVAVMTEMAEDAQEEGKHFVFIRIPESLLPLERGEKYEDPITDILLDAGLGDVVGGGSQLGEGNTIAYCGVDVTLTDRKRGLKLLQSALRQLGAPSGTVIEEFLPEFCEHNI